MSNLSSKPKISKLQRLRKSFGKNDLVTQMPNLIKVQKDSYEMFLQSNTHYLERKNIGVQSVFKTIFPIEDPMGLATLEFVKYEFETPKYDVDESKQRGVNYASPLKITSRLIVWEKDPDTGAKEIKGIKEQEVYIGDLPLMTHKGTFIISGTERVIVSQLHRSPGGFFNHDFGKTHSTNKFLYSARIIPDRGSWLDFEFDAKDLVYFRIDRKRKLPVTTLLRAIGLNSQEILDSFYAKTSYTKTGDKWKALFNFEQNKGLKITYDLIDAGSKQILVESGTRLTARVIKKLQEANFTESIVDQNYLLGKYIAEDIINSKTGEVIAVTGSEITGEVLTKIEELSLKSFTTLDIDNVNVGPYIRNTMLVDKNLNMDEALIDIYRVLRPGESAISESALAFLNSLFFDKERYDLSEVGRVKLNSRLDLNIDESHHTLTKEDIIAVIKKLISIKDGLDVVDDIDHLGNRRVRAVGELVENQFRIALIRIERAIIERISAVDVDAVMPHDLINSKILGSVIREFFGTSQLSQFMDQTNPLSEITHKRRLSALGPGGLSRDRASFEVRDVHLSHYGRICPIETPEGQNIGLINSMATFARINKYGFIESPYRKVIDCKITDEVIYMSALDEGKYIIAQANAKLDHDNNLIDMTTCRKNGDFVIVPPEEVEYIDVSPMQLVSVAASLIPFLENDDANRALMGSNMQRQAVPLLKSASPLVGTGIESIVAIDSGAAVTAKRAGYVEQVDANRIVIKSLSSSEESPGVDIYNLLKYQKSNFNTCINQNPLVFVGQFVEKNQVIADGPCTDHGELALGQNVLVAFMSWNGYSFEDSILISERIVKNDVFTSIHIEEYEIVARDTKLGPEEITRHIPNVGEEQLSHLDEVGIVHIGAEVKAGDILVGKVTPKSGESPSTPEEKLLKAIFGEKSREVRDTSLKLPAGAGGTVIGVQHFSRRGIEKDDRALSIERYEIERLAKDRDDEYKIVQNFVHNRISSLLLDKIIVSGPKNIKPGSKVNQELLTSYTLAQITQIVVEDHDVMEEVTKLKKHMSNTALILEKNFLNKVEKLQSGDDLLPGALKVIKVYVATKSKIQAGDKMAGRHGNKGVISRIVPIEDMPYLEDGTPVDMVLNPLGVPSRMNIGQILETHLGWASAKLGQSITKLIDEYYDKQETALPKLKNYMKEIYQNQSASEIALLNDDEFIEFTKTLQRGVPFTTPVFDGAKTSDITDMFDLAGIHSSGQVKMIDGRTGEYFDRSITVGYMYMLKLHHLVDDKIHARSVGPYSLVTQQPLGGKSHFGGQRFGEMECWALQAYGAAYTLQEMLTVKSDDVNGRTMTYGALIRGDQNFETGVPESFNVMIKEIRSLCLNIELGNDDNQ